MFGKVLNMPLHSHAIFGVIQSTQSPNTPKIKAIFDMKIGPNAKHSKRKMTPSKKINSDEGSIVSHLILTLLPDSECFEERILA